MKRADASPTSSAACGLQVQHKSLDLLRMPPDDPPVPGLCRSNSMRSTVDSAQLSSASSSIWGAIPGSTGCCSAAFKLRRRGAHYV